MSTSAIAPEPPVSVARLSVKFSIVAVASIRWIITSLISRADSHETTMPARICPSWMRLARSRMPFITARQALLKSYTAVRPETPMPSATRQAVAGSNCSRQTPA